MSSFLKKKDFLKFLKESGIKVTTVFFGYEGEDYSSLEHGSLDSLIKTVGLRNPKLKDERLKKTLQIADFAKDVGAAAIGGHVGVISEDREDPEYKGLVDTSRKIAKYCKKNGLNIALETGLETSDILLKFIDDVGEENLKINFDPANIFFHGKEDPMDALENLKEYVISVHCKDFKKSTKKGTRPVEVPFGEGDVGAERFLGKLKEIGYNAALNIERESRDYEQQKHDMLKIKERIEKLKTKILT